MLSLFLVETLYETYFLGLLFSSSKLERLSKNLANAF